MNRTGGAGQHIEDREVGVEGRGEGGKAGGSRISGRPPPPPVNEAYVHAITMDGSKPQTQFNGNTH